MIFEPVELLSKSAIGQDELGNILYEYLPEKIVRGRLTQWTADEVALVGRETVQTDRKLLTDATLEDLSGISQIRIEGKRYVITKIMDLKRWRLLYVRRYGDNENPMERI